VEKINLPARSRFGEGRAAPLSVRIQGRQAREEIQFDTSDDFP